MKRLPIRHRWSGKQFQMLYRKIDWIVQLLALSVAFCCFLIIQCKSLPELKEKFAHADIRLLAGGIFLFCCLQIGKVIRLYLLLIEHNLPFGRFLQVYVRTTYVNICLPFKLGEAYRWFCYGWETGDYRLSFFSMATERFFDSCVLLPLLLLCELTGEKKLSVVSSFLIVFVLLFLLFYLYYPQLYRYLNRMLVLKSNGKRGIFWLKRLKSLKEWHAYVYEMVHEKAVLLCLLSVAAWGLEAMMFFILTRAFGLDYSWGSFSRYANAAWSGTQNLIATAYCMIGAVGFGMTTVLLYVVRKWRKGHVSV